MTPPPRENRGYAYVDGKAPVDLWTRIYYQKSIGLTITVIVMPYRYC